MLAIVGRAVIKPEAQWQVVSVGECGEDISATPAATGTQLFVRMEKALYCFERPNG